MTAATKHTLRAIARRWRDLHEEIKNHEQVLAQLTTRHAPQLDQAFGVGPDTAAEMLIVAGDNPDRVRSEAAWAKLCGVAPIPASSGKTTRHRLNRGGHRQANAALYRVVIVRMQHHAPTRAYVTRRTAEGNTKAEIIRCLKRLLPREIWPSCDRSVNRPPSLQPPLDGYRSINALMECLIGPYKAECIDRHRRLPRRPYKTVTDVEYATAGWVDRFNNRRLHSSLNYLPPIEYEQAQYAALNPEMQPA